MTLPLFQIKRWNNQRIILEATIVPRATYQSYGRRYHQTVDSVGEYTQYWHGIVLFLLSKFLSSARNPDLIVWYRLVLH